MVDDLAWGAPLISLIYGNLREAGLIHHWKAEQNRDGIVCHPYFFSP